MTISVVTIRMPRYVHLNVSHKLAHGFVPRHLYMAAVAMICFLFLTTSLNVYFMKRNLHKLAEIYALPEQRNDYCMHFYQAKIIEADFSFSLDW